MASLVQNKDEDSNTNTAPPQPESEEQQISDQVAPPPADENLPANENSNEEGSRPDRHSDDEGVIEVQNTASNIAGDIMSLQEQIHNHDHNHESGDCKCESDEKKIVLPGDLVELNPESDYLYIVGTQGQKV
mmetsp:Transcript_1190/g.1726  ORF Transcript_1190/g.1726 Transcript_1190/m.1726 type:complete len:132 (-) Transcript_1190:9-404(-)